MNDRITRQSFLDSGGLAALRTTTGRSLADVGAAAMEKAHEAQKTQPAPPKAKRGASGKPLVARFIEREAGKGELVFVLPLPPQVISPNGRGHWAKKSRAVRQYREQCANLMRATHQPPLSPGRVVIDLEFYLCRVVNDRTSLYPRDEDNARGAMKAAQDALKDAALIAGDGKDFVRMGKTTLYTQAKEHRGFTCVVMTLRKDKGE